MTEALAERREAIFVIHPTSEKHALEMAAARAREGESTLGVFKHPSSGWYIARYGQALANRETSE